MAAIRRTALFSKLNPTAYKSVESATLFCKMRGNPNVELVHWLHQILAGQDSDLHRIVRNFGLDPSRLAADLTANLDKLPRGATAISNFSAHLEGAIERGWVYASLLFNATRVRTGHLVIGLLKTPDLAPFFVGLSKELPKINVETLTDNFAGITAGSPEEGTEQPAAAGEEGGAPAASADGSPAPAAMGKGEALAKYSVDLTEKAKKGEVDPVLGRDTEIRQVIDILMRRRQNNPLLAGEAGVGKTAVVEGFAARIARGDVPPALKDVSLRSLDMGLLQAGASMKGEFENRLRQVIEEVQSSPKPIILFIDEAHTLIGAGGAAGTGDAANLLKPALARGTLRTIAATTWAEYKKYIEKDPALTRRFQAIKVEEPSEDTAVQMIRGLSTTLEKHHQVLILDEALEAAARLSHRYIPSRQLPDKAVSLIDTACARVAVSQHATPAALEDCTRRIENFQTELDILARETALGRDSLERSAKLAAEMAEEKARRGILDVRYQEEKMAVEKIFALREQLKVPVATNGSSTLPGGSASSSGTSVAMPGTPSAMINGSSASPVTLSALRAAEAELKSIQGEEPLILPSVDEQAVAAVVADWTGIPVGRMVKDEIQAVLHIADTLEKRVIGQRHALDGIAKRIQTARARLDNPNKPIGVFLLAGTSGVGKTETALALAEVLYGGEQNLITINMSEFQEAHTVSTLKGAPPGYVGYGEGGVLTEAVRRRPYSVVLLDEVEKAHSDVHEIFFQVFDKGFMEDGEGRLIDFHNTVIILTSNAGSDLIQSLCKDPDLMPDPEGIAKALRPALLKVFPAALLGRLTVVPYYPLSDAMLKSIIRLQLGRIEKRLAANHDVTFAYGDDVVDLIASRCTEMESGGRMIDAILTQTVLPEMSREFLTRMMGGEKVRAVRVEAKDGAFGYVFE